jgi:HK97 family phage major capsid protein
MEHITKLRTEYGTLRERLDALAGILTKETRGFNETEKTEFDTIKARLAAIEEELKPLEEMEKIRANKIENMPGPVTGKKESEEQRSLKAYSINEVIKARINGTQLKGREGEWAQEVSKRADGNGTPASPYGVPHEYLLEKNKKRDYTATGTTTETLDEGGMLIETDKPGLIDALGDYMVISQMGIRRLSNLRGNLSLPKELTKPSASFATETGAAADQAGLFDTVDLSPKRLAGYIDYTMQMMTQPTIAIEPYVRERLNYSVADAVQKNFLVGTGTSNAPTGVLTALLATGLYTLGGRVLESGGTLDWDSVVDLETAVDISNALQGSTGYVMNSKLRGALKTTAKGASTNDHYLWEMRDPQNPINGYAAWVTNHILSTSTGTALTGGTATPLTFGNWNDSVLASWGDIFIDLDKQYVGTGIYRLVINTFWDVAVLRTQSFAMLNDVTTSFYSGS